MRFSVKGAAVERKAVTRAFEVKATDDGARTFTGLAAAFSLDQGGDIILPGAFKRTLKHWRSSKGALIPLIDSHNYGSVRNVVGKMTEADETAEGLEATFEMIDGPDGDEVFRRVKGGYVSGLSIGYNTVAVGRDPTEEERHAGIWRFIKELRLLENSVVIFPMNMDARVDAASVKAVIESFSGRELTNDEIEELKSLQQKLSALIAAPGETVAPPAAGLAPEDPRRIALDERVRGLKIGSLGLVA